MATRRSIVLTLAAAVCLLSCALLDTLGLSGPKAPPAKVEVSGYTSAQEEKG